MEENKFKIIATKISPEVDARIEKIAAHKGMTKYRLIQMVLDTLVRYMDSAHNMTAEMEQVMTIFEHMQGWGDALNLADPTAKKEIIQAIYMMEDPTGKRKGVRCSMVTHDLMGHFLQTENIVQMFERITEVLLPDTYMRLRKLAVDMNCNSLVELVNLLADVAQLEKFNEEFRKDFEDADRSEWGVKPVDAPYRRKHHKGIDCMEQTTIDFGDDEAQ